MAANNDRLDFLQIMRAFAALLVAMSHIFKEMFGGTMAATHPNLYEAAISLQFGVDIFFLISGFIVLYVTHDSPGGQGQSIDFVKKRLIRIVPTYWLFTTLMIVATLAAPQQLNRPNESYLYFIYSYLFIPASRPLDGEAAPVLGVGWTLNFEMFFYIVFALVLLFWNRKRVVALTALFAIIVFFGYFSSPSFVPVWYWSRSVILEFLFGILIAHVFVKKSIRLSLPIGTALIVLGILIWQITYAFWPVTNHHVNIRGLTWGIAAALIFGGVALSPVRDALTRIPLAAMLVVIGNASYSLYLCHMFVVRAFTLAIGRQFDGWIMIVYPAVTLAGCTAVAILCYYYFELPMNQLGRTLLLRKRQTVQKQGVAG